MIKTSNRFAQLFRNSKILNGRALSMIERIKPFLPNKANVLDIGSGTAHIGFHLRDIGHKITLVDVKNVSSFVELQPVIFNGKELPFKSKQFEVALLVTVLHHCKDPEAILLEAGRVAHKVIIVEDVFSGVFQKYLTYCMDSIVNFEFFGHPHSNKTTSEWLHFCRKSNFEILHVSEFNFWLFFTGAVICLDIPTT